MMIPLTCMPTEECKHGAGWLSLRSAYLSRGFGPVPVDRAREALL